MTVIMASYDKKDLVQPLPGVGLEEELLLATLFSSPPPVAAFLLSTFLAGLPLTCRGGPPGNNPCNTNDMNHCVKFHLQLASAGDQWLPVHPQFVDVSVCDRNSLYRSATSAASNGQAVIEGWLTALVRGVWRPIDQTDSVAHQIVQGKMHTTANVCEQLILQEQRYSQGVCTKLLHRILYCCTPKGCTLTFCTFYIS